MIFYLMFSTVSVLLLLVGLLAFLADDADKPLGHDRDRVRYRTGPRPALCAVLRDAHQQRELCRHAVLATLVTALAFHHPGLLQSPLLGPRRRYVARSPPPTGGALCPGAEADRERAVLRVLPATDLRHPRRQSHFCPVPTHPSNGLLSRHLQILLRGLRISARRPSHPRRHRPEYFRGTL